MSKIRQISINQLKECLKIILVPGSKQIVTPFIWGKPGIGKSAAIKQFRDILEKETKTKFDIIDHLEMIKEDG